MQWGDQLDFFEQVEKGGGTTPLRDMPKLRDGDHKLYSAFRRLSASRSYSDGFPQAIVISEASGYARDLLGYKTRDKIGQFLDMVQILDSEFLSFKTTKIKEQIAADKAKK